MKVRKIFESNNQAGFYNPFSDELDEEKSKPISLKDNGNMLAKAKDDFQLTKLKWTKKGSSFMVKANDKFRKGEIVEICPVILVTESAKSIPKINDIIFEIDKEKDQYGLVLGYGSLYTHSDTPNMDFAYNASSKQMYFIARRAINTNEELTIDFGIEYFSEQTDLSELNDKLKEIGLDPVDELDESGMERNAADLTQDAFKREMGDPQNRNNPVRSGVAITGLGQQ